MPSKKTPIIEHVFNQRFDPVGLAVTPHVVTFDDIDRATTETGSSLSRGNLANFWKDLVRGNPTPHGPASVLAAGYTGEDAIGVQEHACFWFVPFPEGQTTAFALPLTPSEAALTRLSKCSH